MNHRHGFIIRHSLCALLQHARIVSGAYKLSGKQQGREPTPEERARGEVIGFRDLTDEEKLVDAVETMKRQIEIVSDAVDELPAEGP